MDDDDWLSSSFRDREILRIDNGDRPSIQNVGEGEEYRKLRTAINNERVGEGKIQKIDGHDWLSKNWRYRVIQRIDDNGLFEKNEWMNEWMNK